MNAPKAEFIIPKKAKKRGRKFGTYQEEFPTIVGPAATYTEYNPRANRAMAAALDRARRDQPELISLSSTVPDFRKD